MGDEIGFIGLGNMGGRMAARLVEQGRPVAGYDVRPDLAAQAGARAAGSVAEVAADASVILLSLPDSHVVEAVVGGGLLAGARAGQVIVDLSTAAPASTRSIHQQMAARGVAYLDAGISGGAAAADKGTLTLMVGGDAGALEEIRAVLDCFAAEIFYCGDSGSGHTAKLLNNFLNAVSLAATAEVMVAGKKAGLDLGVLLDIINASSGVNFASLNRFPKIIHGDYLKGGLTNTLMMKDVTLYTDLVASLGVASLNASGPLASFGLAKALGYADEISNTVVDAIGDVSGGVRLHTGDLPPPATCLPATGAPAKEPRRDHRARPELRPAHRPARPHLYRGGVGGSGAAHDRRRHHEHGLLPARGADVLAFPRTRPDPARPRRRRADLHRRGAAAPAAAGGRGLGAAGRAALAWGRPRLVPDPPGDLARHDHVGR